MLNSHDEIDAIVINDVRKIVGQFADDLWNVIKNNERSLAAVLQVYDLFYHLSGLKINYDKTEIMRIGSLREANAADYSLFQLKWTSGPVKILGIDVYNDLTLMAQCNYNNFKQKFEQRLKGWKHRGLSLIGRILIVNSLLLSQLVYKMMMVCSMTEYQYVELKTIVVDFLWDGKKPKIAYDKLILDHPHGGLKLHDIRIKDKSMKLSWIPKLLIENEWSKMMQWFFPIPIKLMFMSNIKDTLKD